MVLFAECQFLHLMVNYLHGQVWKSRVIGPHHASVVDEYRGGRTAPHPKGRLAFGSTPLTGCAQHGTQFHGIPIATSTVAWITGTVTAAEFGHRRRTAAGTGPRRGVCAARAQGRAAGRPPLGKQIGAGKPGAQSKGQARAV